MSESIPAFPSVCLGDPGHPSSVPGMSLRDWFAGQTLGAISGSVAMAVGDGRIPPDTAPKLAATLAYDIADAMMAERAPREIGRDQ